MKIEIEFIRLCPYCRKRAKKRKATCGDALCQYKHHLKYLRDYWKKYCKKPTKNNI